MVAGQQKLDLSLLRRRHDPSATSSASLSPTVPSLESPVSFQALAARAVSDTTMVQRNKLNRPPARPSMFIEETDDDDSMAPKSNHGAPADPKSVDVIRKSVEEEPMRRAKSQCFDDFFSTRGRELSLRDRLSQKSVIVAELKLSKTVRMCYITFGTRKPLGSNSMSRSQTIKPLLWRSHLAWRKSIRKTNRL